MGTMDKEKDRFVWAGKGDPTSEQEYQLRKINEAINGEHYYICCPGFFEAMKKIREYKRITGEKMPEEEERKLIEPFEDNEFKKFKEEIRKRHKD